MEYDLNSSINLKTTSNIPRSKSIIDKAKQEKNSTKRNKTNNKSMSRRNSVESVNKTTQDSNIQVHIRVN